MSLGIPYMGSKRKLSGDILSFIKNRHPDMTDFFDLFGGGGAVSFTAIKDHRFRVHYNELNSHIFSLVKYLKNNKTFDQKFYDWVTREEFFRQCNRTDADWYSGFVMSCWSFGNSQSSYLYGRDIEEIKRLAHSFVVFGDLDAMRELKLDIPQLLDIKDIQQRRIVFCDYVGKTEIGRFDIQNPERLAQLQRLQNLENINKLTGLTKTEKLSVTNLSYENVIITGTNPIIYCDIPYRGTVEYKKGGFNYERFYDWFRSLEYAAYLSEYDAPFLEVTAFTHRSSLSATNNKKKTVEKLYWNEKGTALKSTLL